jgi:geranylgeranyl pyrophosphate synthase
MYDVVDSDVTVLRDASRHILAAGGKRIRPRLAMLAHVAVGGRQVEELAPIAAAVELVHTASVVHDDINDHGVLRRGRPSVNALWGRTFALLTGDYLFTKVYELMAPFKDFNIPLAEATKALVEGETLQAQAVKENNFTRAVYYDIIARKTAALFRAAGTLGADFAGAPRAQVDALGNYAFNIGLAFQIVDDILDLTASPEQLGKTSGIDVEQGRGLATAFSSDTPAVDPMQSIKQKVLSGDSLTEGRQQAYMLVQSAVNELDVLPASDAKTALSDLAFQVVDREF